MNGASSSFDPFSCKHIIRAQHEVCRVSSWELPVNRAEVGRVGRAAEARPNDFEGAEVSHPSRNERRRSGGCLLVTSSALLPAA